MLPSSIIGEIGRIFPFHTFFIRVEQNSAKNLYIVFDVRDKISKYLQRLVKTLPSTFPTRGVTLLVCAMMAVQSAHSFYIDHIPGLDPQKKITQYTHRVWQSEQGLPQNSVNAITQDAAGYLWLATQEGLVRFDGIDLYVVDKKHLSSLKTNYVWTLIATPDSSLWFALQGGGLYRLKNSSLKEYSVAHGLPSNHVEALHVDRHGRLWIGTHDGLAEAVGDSFIVHLRGEAFLHYEVQVITSDGEGALWIGTNGGGLFKMQHGTLRRFTARDGLPADVIVALHVDGKGGMLVGTSLGVRVVRGDSIVPFEVDGTVLRETALSFHRDHSGSLWIGTAGKGLIRVSNNRSESFGPDQGLSDGFVKSLFEDREGNLWIGTYSGGLNLLTDGLFHRFTRKEGLSNDFILSVCEDASGTMWFGTYGGGVNTLRSKAIPITPLKVPLPIDIVSSLLLDDDGGMWIGTYGGGLVKRTKDGRMFSYTVRRGLPTNFILSLMKDSRGTLWVGTTNGLARISGQDVKTIRLTDRANQYPVVALCETKDGIIWFATEGGGLGQFAPAGLAFFTSAQGLPTDLITALFEDEEGTLWIGTDGGGLVRYRNNRFVTIDSRAGLGDDVVFCVLDDGHGNLWMSSNKGIFRVNRQALNKYADGELERITSISYGRGDGMESNECTGRRQPVAWRKSDGTLWFSTTKGVVMVDPTHLGLRTSPIPLVIEAVIAENGPVSTSRDVTLAPGVDRLEIRYTALTFRAPEKVRFRYRLEGVEERWIEAGMRRSAFYTNLGPGSYVFAVQAEHADGRWAANEARVYLTIRPFFYQTWYFIGGVVCAFLLLGYAGYRLRTMRLRGREQELRKLVRERTKDLELEIQERRKVEEALRASEQRFRDIVEHSTNLFYVHDTNHVLTYVSPQSIDFLGYSPGEALVRWTEFLTDHPMNSIGIERTERAIATGQRQPKYELELRRKDGRKILVEVHEAPVVRYGKTVAIVGALTDITDRKRLEEQLRQASKLQSIGVLAGGIAHNFNNILGIILAYASMLRRERANVTRFQDGLEAIHKTVERGAALVRQLLTFARRTDVNLQVVDVNTTVRELVSMVNETFPKTVSFKLDLEEELPPVQIDPNQFHQVLLNLCVNARDAMMGEGILTLRTAKVDSSDFLRRFPLAESGEYVSVAVADTGVGIDESIKQKIFEPFFTTKEVGKGTGLGLSVVYGIVESHKGLIDLTSTVGRGTTFTVYLPAAKERDGVSVGTDGTIPEARGGEETILVVEDEHMLVDLLRSLLERKGYTVLTAEEGDEALQLFAEKHRQIDLVLMDVGLPKVSGWEALQSMRERDPNIPIILASGYLGAEAEERSLEAGASAYISKPYVPETVHAIVRRVLDGTRTVREKHAASDIRSRTV